MEYLTLQDIPHRHYDPVASHRMTSSQSSERSIGSMAAAVSPLQQSLVSPTSPIPSMDLPAPAVRPISEWDTLHQLRRNEQPRRRPSRERASLRSSRSLEFDQLASVRRDEDLDRMLRRRLPSPDPYYDQGGHTYSRRSDPFASPFSRNGSRNDIRQVTSYRRTLTSEQNHHLRSSPPIQPGEHQVSLPSFNEVRCSASLH